MSLINLLFGVGKSPAPALTQHSLQATSPTATRRETLRLALRDTLQRHGIPTEWIGGETLTLTIHGERLLHWRLIVKHWDPRILTHGVAIQQALVRRVTAFDPLAPEWLHGISWQFALEDESACPPMPNAASWTAPVRDESDPRADLDRLFAVRDADFQQHAGGPSPGWSRTEPASL
jgi:hypothetical protein